MKFLTLFLPLCFIADEALGAVYHKTDSIVGDEFYRAFYFDNITDPSHGHVVYVNQPTAIQQNLSFVSDDTIILRADYKTLLTSDSPGRSSIRVSSNKQYTTFTAIFDMRHMPEGCGTWPAIWTLGSNWPYRGEINIVEGVNSLGPNAASLHTGSYCNVPASRDQTGTSTGTNCATYETQNAGCGVKFPDQPNNPISFGAGFNTHIGGWYALERAEHYFKIWFWSRSDTTVPDEVKNGDTESIDTASWGTPVAYWPDDLCDFQDHFGPHNIIIDLNICGDWAGNDAVFQSSGCQGTCQDFVNNNPATFFSAYFDFAWINIYEPNAPCSSNFPYTRSRASSQIVLSP